MPACEAATPLWKLFNPCKVVVKVAGVVTVAGWWVAVPRCVCWLVRPPIVLMECIEATPVCGPPAGPPTAPMIWADIGPVPAVT